MIQYRTSLVVQWLRLCFQGRGHKVSSLVWEIKSHQAIAQPKSKIKVFPGGSAGKGSPAMQETWVQSLGWEDPLEEGMASHSSILAWRIPIDRGA